MEYLKHKNETIKVYKLRLFRNKDVYGLTAQQIADLINKETGDNYSESTYRKWYKTYSEGFEDGVKESLSDDEVLKKYELQKKEIYKERRKLRDENIELRALLNEQARMDLFFERIDEAVERLREKRILPLPSPIVVENDKSDAIVAAFADCHYGSEFVINGFGGEVLNEYNPDVFKRRMLELRDELISFGAIHSTKRLYLVDLGDSIDGLLHLSQLKSLKGNIVDHILDYADFIYIWLSSLSEYFVIDFYTSEGNHSDLRLLTGKKGDFPHENLEKMYSRYLKRLLKDNPNIMVHDSLDGLNYFNVNGFNFLSAHGNKESNVKNSIFEYESTYNIKIDYFLVGHLHFKNEFDVAKGKEVIQVRSIVGINEFARDHKKTSDAGATMFIVRKGYGKKYINEVKFK